MTVVVEATGIAILIALGYFFGSRAERRHFRSIVRRENEFSALPVVASRTPPVDKRYQQALVTGSVVVASDYFKNFTASLINLFGGRVTPFESLIDRARREAVLRMKEEAAGFSADYVFNVKFETSQITGSATIEVLAYGTALTSASAD